MPRLKILISFLLLVLSGNCIAQNGQSLIGRWKYVEYHGNDGARDYIQHVKNGRVYIFEKNKVVRDDKGRTGTYEIDGNRLTINFPEGSLHYIFHQGGDHTKLSMSRVSDKFEIMCDEGCSELYRRI